MRGERGVGDVEPAEQNPATDSRQKAPVRQDALLFAELLQKRTIDAGDKMKKERLPQSSECTMAVRTRSAEYDDT